MKLDLVKSLIAVAISALLAYACYEICDYDRVQWVITIGAFLTLGITSVFSLGITLEQVRSSTMLKTLAWVILIVEIITNGIFVFFDFSVPVYVIINGLILLIFALIYNSIYRTKMKKIQHVYVTTSGAILGCATVFNTSPNNL